LGRLLFATWGEALNREDAEAQRINELTGRVIGCCIEVHKALGPGLLESVYEECLSFEMGEKGLRFERQKELPIIYKGVRLNSAYRIDFIVEKTVIVELKAVERVMPVHKGQILSYMKLIDSRIGLLINFNVPVLKNGIDRFVL